MLLRSLLRTVLAAVVIAAALTSGRAVEVSYLSNLSVRTSMANGQTLIVGGVVSGGSKTILVRAGGPALNKFGLNGMADPRLALYTSGSSPVATSDNWNSALAPVFTSVGAFAYDPGSRDAALTQSLNGSFTVQASGTGAGTILVEAYDAEARIYPRMINLSARNRVGTDADILIAGFTVAGTGTKRLLVRAVGPGLAAFGVPGTLADPLLQFFDSKGTRLATNDTWDPALAQTFATVGAFGLPAGSKDAALIVEVSAGQNYTVQVSGADGGTGEALVEVYEIESAFSELRLPNLLGPAASQLGFPLRTNRLPSTGDVRIKTLFVDFSDAVATRTPQSVFAQISPGAPDFWRTTSYGRMRTTLDPVLTWLRMSKPTTQYGWTELTAATHRAYIQEAVNLALAAGADFSSADAIVVMANPDATVLYNGPTYTAGGIVAGDRTIAVACTSGYDLRTWGYKWLNHEGGHMLGLPDLYTFTATNFYRYVGDFGMMGNITGAAPEYFAWERWLLGWLDDDQVVRAAPGTTTVSLTPVELAGGRKMVVAPLTATSAVVAEYRRATGLDSALPSSGPLVYVVDTTASSGNGPFKILPLDENDNRKLDRLLKVGQTITYSGVSVRYVSGDANAVTLEVIRP